MLINLESDRDAQEALRAVRSWVQDVARSRCDEVGEVLARLDEAEQWMRKKISANPVADEEG